MPFIIPWLEVPTSYPTKSSSPPGMAGMLCSSKGGFKEPSLPWDAHSDSGPRLWEHSLTWEPGHASQSVRWLGRPPKPPLQTYPTLATLEIPGMPGSRWGFQESHALPCDLHLDPGMPGSQSANLNVCQGRLTLGSIPGLRGLPIFLCSGCLSRWETTTHWSENALKIYP